MWNVVTQTLCLLTVIVLIRILFPQLTDDTLSMSRGSQEEWYYVITWLCSMSVPSKLVEETSNSLLAVKWKVRFNHQEVLEKPFFQIVLLQQISFCLRSHLRLIFSIFKVTRVTIILLIKAVMCVFIYVFYIPKPILIDYEKVLLQWLKQRLITFLYGF